MLFGVGFLFAFYFLTKMYGEVNFPIWLEYAVGITALLLIFVGALFELNPFLLFKSANGLKEVENEVFVELWTGLEKVTDGSMESEKINIDIAAHSAWTSFRPREFNDENRPECAPKERLVEYGEALCKCSQTIEKLDLEGQLWKSLGEYARDENITKRFRVLLLHPSNPQSMDIRQKQLTKRGDIVEENRDATIDQYFTMFSIWVLSKKYTGMKFIVKLLRNTNMPYSYYRSENKALIALLGSIGLANKAPCIVLNREEHWFDYYCKDFETLWNLETNKTINFQSESLSNNTVNKFSELEISLHEKSDALFLNFKKCVDKMITDSRTPTE